MGGYRWRAGHCPSDCTQSLQRHMFTAAVTTLRVLCGSPLGARLFENRGQAGLFGCMWRGDDIEKIERSAGGNEDAGSDERLT